MSDTLAENRQAFEEAGSAIEESAKPTAQYAETMQKVADSFTAVEQAYPSHLSDPGAFFFNNPEAADNLSVFQQALSDPEPFQMIQDHLNATGQTWQTFDTSIGKSNAQMLQTMRENSSVVYDQLSNVSSGMGDIVSSTQDANNAVADFLNLGQDQRLNALGGVGTKLYGPLEDAKSARSSAADWWSGQSETLFGEGGFMGILNDLAMPLMALQMIGAGIGAIGQSIYDSAAIAEGPGAHGYGTFTGAVDTLNASIQTSKQNFSEGFGQGALPALKGLNDANATGGGFDLGAWMGKGFGMETGLIGDILGIGLGGLIGIPPNPISDKLIRGGEEGLSNYWADWTGQPEPFPGPQPPDQAQVAIQQVMAQMPQQLAIQTAQMQAMANDPQFLAAQAYLSSQQAKAQREQASFDVSHYGTGSPLDYVVNDDGSHTSMQDVIRQQMARASGDYGMAPAYVDPNATCFIAGTHILMADGTEKAIETLQEGEQVQGHDGEKQVVTTILATIKPLPKQVYELLFSDGKSLTLTDAHPIATVQGWKSLNPLATKRENPDVSVSLLEIDDVVITVNGTCVLTAIEPGEIVQVYNLTVDEPHTFYANGVLVHNKMANQIAPQIADQVQNIQLPHMDLSGIASNIGAAFSNIQLPQISAARSQGYNCHTSTSLA
jgi:hypothetical protein